MTIHLNQISGLLATRDSLVRLLSNPLVEWIVVDGGSTPASLQDEQVLRDTRKLADHFCSEPDKGIYDAMNKGTRLASGDYLLYLNAGDLLHPEFEFEMAQALGSDAGPCMIWGSSWDKDHKGNVYQRKTRSPFWLRYGMAVCHQAVLFRKEDLGKEPYDLSLNIAADYDLVCRLYRQGLNIVRAPLAICIFDLIGASSDDHERTLEQESMVRVRHFSIPQPFSRLLVIFKRYLWKFNIQYPLQRALWRRWF